jgi:hypothetical protein
MHGPHALIEHLRTSLYHPRSDAHSNAICRGVLRDLLDNCPAFAAKAARGEIVAQLNHTVTVGHQEWNVDLAVGAPRGLPSPPTSGERITFAPPAIIELALEAKSVMTEHGKARRNRLRDLQAFHVHAHAYDPRVVALGLVIVNVAEHFWSPTRDAADVTSHRNITALAQGTVDLYRNLPLRLRPNDGPGLEAASVIVIRHDNMRKNAALPPGAPPPVETSLVTGSPAPAPGDPLDYATMIVRACAAYRERWT